MELKHKKQKILVPEGSYLAYDHCSNAILLENSFPKEDVFIRTGSAEALEVDGIRCSVFDFSRLALSAAKLGKAKWWYFNTPWYFNPINGTKGFCSDGFGETI